jgi:flagellar capping protein FliD
METDPIAVQNFIAGEDGDGGVFQVFSTMLQDYTKSGGLLSASKTRIDTQVSAINNRLDSMESALATRRAALQKEYIAADLAMTRLKAQSSSLSAAGSGYRLF